jgi:transglutaminase-like putative cysteine protease
MDEFLAPGRYLDSDAPAQTEFARSVTAGAGSDLERIVRLYRVIRDSIAYDPYVDLADPANYRASSVLTGGRGFCVGKAAVLAASARSLGIPARVGYADVKNHLTSPKLYAQMQTDVFLWHSYAEVFVEGRWAKATVAFNLALCDRIGVQPLEFDGRNDSLFQPFDRQGRRHMEYLKDRGTFADVPFETIQSDFRAAYPALMASKGVQGDFHAEAVAGSEL